MPTPPKTTQDIADGGGRLFKGRGLGQLGAWKCVACGVENTGEFKRGCSSCGAGAPGVQVQRTEDAAPPERRPAPKVAPLAGTPTKRSLSDQLRQRATAAVDYDEIERRLANVLEARLGGGYSAQERATLYFALECYITLWEDGQIEPVGGLNLSATKQLAAKVAPDEGLEIQTDGNRTTTETARTGDQAGDDATGSDDAPDLGGYAPDDDGDDSSGSAEPDPLDLRTGPRDARTAPRHAAPQLVDPDPGPDESGQDDPDRNSE